jgi:dephospho-CoA kinase
MIKIGLTGGIGSGKTVVASLLEMMGVPVYIADEESKRLTDTSPAIREKLIDLLGEEIYSPRGVNRRLLASRIFNQPEYLREVNRIIHPEVNRHFLDWVSRRDTDACAIETAILFESGFDSAVDIRLMVYAPVELRIERACRRGMQTREEIRQRISNQLSDESKKAMSDYTIWNDGSHALIPQVFVFTLQLQNLK